MRLQNCTWPEVKAYLETSRGILMATGSTEQHGPMGVLGTDSFCAETIAWAVGAETGAMVGPTITVGMSEHHMTFAGSMAVRPSTYVAFIRDCILTLADHGFERFLFVNGHGGNTASLTAAFSEIYGDLRRGHGAAAPDVRLKTLKWFENEAVEALSQELFGHTATGHASAAEVSVAQFADPAANVKSAPLDPQHAPGFDHVWYDSRNFRRRFADGRIDSDPSVASPEAGAKLVETAAAHIAGIYRAFVAEE